MLVQHVILVNSEMEITLYSSRASFQDSTKAESSQISLCESCFAGILSQYMDMQVGASSSTARSQNAGTVDFTTVVKAPVPRKKVEVFALRFAASDFVAQIKIYTMSKIAEEKGRKRKGMENVLRRTMRNADSTI